MGHVFQRLDEIWKNFRQRRVHAKSFAAQQNKDEAYDAKDRGTRMVALAQIVGSVGRYHDFDGEFRLRQHLPAEKLEHVKQLIKGGVPLPPVKLYQIKDEYYVLDGNHRVAAAKEAGWQDIEACIVEFLPSPTTLENIVYREKADFLEKTGFQDDFDLTEVGQYAYLLEQIRQHQDALAQCAGQPVSFHDAAEDWRKTIYQPMVRLIARSHLLAAFPQRSMTDLYTYISSHQWQRGQARAYHKEIDDLIPNDMEEFRKIMAGKRDADYPDMRREITVFILMNVSGRKEERIMEKLFAIDEVRELHSVHGTFDIITKIVLTRDLLSSDAEIISNFVNDHIRQMPGVISTQTLIPGYSKTKDA